MAPRRLDALSDALIADPLAVPEDDVHDADVGPTSTHRCGSSRACGHRRAVLTRTATVRAGSKLERQATDARCEWDTTRAKILGPSRPAARGRGTPSTHALNTIAGLADAGQLGRRPVVRRRARPVVDDAAATPRCCGRGKPPAASPMIERDQLRGRLDAYRAKAHGLGLDEDDDVTETYERSQAALYVAPADLTARPRSSSGTNAC